MGHTVVIATSATRMQVAPLARELGVEHVVCTEMAVVDGVLTGSVVRPVPWGTGKLNAVIEFLNRHDIEAASTHAYANGDEDIPLLTAVGHPHPVNPQPKLATVARAHRWPVLEFAGRKPARLDPTPALRTAAAFGTLFTSAGAGVVLGVLKGNRRVGVDVATSLFQTLAGPLAGVTFEVTGEHNAWSHRPAVFFINHQSTMVDFMVATRVIRTGFTAIAKAEVKEMPLVGHLFDMAGVAFVDRSNSKAAISALLPVVQTLKSGISVVIAPEGTRSLTPALGQFKKGGFHLARQAGVPIVPVVVRNSGEIMSRNARTMRPGKVEIAVLPPIDTAAWTANDVSEQAAVMRQLYQDTLENWPSTLATRGR